MADTARGWLRDLREEASDKFDAMAWPSVEDESWRRTDVSRLNLDTYAPAREGESVRPELKEAGASAGFLRFCAGDCVQTAIAESWGERGVRLIPFGDGSDEGRGMLAQLLNKALLTADDRIAMWHFAELRSGAFLYVPSGLEIDEPFYIEFAEGGKGSFNAPQIAIVLDSGARATVIARIAEADQSKLLCSARTDIVLGEGSALRLFDSQALGLESLHFHRVNAQLGKDSSFERIDVEIGARLTKTLIDCSLEGRGAEARLNGLYYCGSDQHMDMGTVQRHLSPGATSRAFYKGAAASGGRAVFQGLIDVGEGASGTDAYLSNRNLLLGEAARADSIPTLRIGNNDVSCSHGSATGRLSEDELFYLKSRGFSGAEAQEMLVLGFFEEVLSRAPEAFREESLAAIRDRLPVAV